MGLMDLVGKAQEKAQEVAGSVGDAADRLLDELNELLPILRGLGFTIRGLRVNVGLTPEVSATFVSSTDTVDPKLVQDQIERNAGKRMIVTALKGLLAAYHVRRQVTDLPVKGIELEITLGLSPNVDVRFVSA